MGSIWETEDPIIPQSEIALEGYPELISYDSRKVLSIEPIKKKEWVYTRSPVLWSTINDGNFFDFYYTFTYPERLKPEYVSYAIYRRGRKIGL